MQKFILFLFLLTGTTAAHAQAKKDSLAKNSPDDIIQPDYSGYKRHWGIYFSLGNTAATGKPDVPTTSDEFNIAEDGQGFSARRTGVSYYPGASYTVGFEYQAKVINRSFFIMDLGIVGYSYNLTVQDEEYAPGFGKFKSYDSSANLYAYRISYTFTELSVGYLYGILKSNKRSLCAGGECHIGYLLGGEGPGYVISTSPSYSSSFQYSPFNFCFSANVRYETTVNLHTLFLIEGYFIYGTGNLLGQLGTTGVKLGFLF